MTVTRKVRASFACGGPICLHGNTVSELRTKMNDVLPLITSLALVADVTPDLIALISAHRSHRESSFNNGTREPLPFARLLFVGRANTLLDRFTVIY